MDSKISEQCSERMADLRSAHFAFVQARIAAIRFRAMLEGIPTIDSMGVLSAISIMDEVDAQAVTLYGKMCLERDLDKEIA